MYFAPTKAIKNMFKIYNNGNPIPMGYSQAVENNVQITNFALFSAAASGVELCLFEEKKQETRLPWCVLKMCGIWR